jgi:hypothetical protein
MSRIHNTADNEAKENRDKIIDSRRTTRALIKW